MVYILAFPVSTLHVVPTSPPMFPPTWSRTYTMVLDWAGEVGAMCGVDPRVFGVSTSCGVHLGLCVLATCGLDQM